jgi:2-polyprenyl-3-methyl-5-hydroxy-6-metoxy-1,4-benzoquinol methylase
VTQAARPDREHTVVAGLRLSWREFGDDPATSFGLWVLDDPDAMLDDLTQEEFDRTDERMPYFALVWPSADALVARLLAGSRLDGQHVLDLGCGLGACGLAAGRLGADVTFFDWEPRAIEIVQASVERQIVPAAKVQYAIGDWRQPPPLGSFDLILGADVLYERRNAPAVAAFLASHLKPGAEAWIADPGRPQAGPFPELAAQSGLEMLGEETVRVGSDAPDITLLRVRRPRIGAPRPG